MPSTAFRHAGFRGGGGGAEIALLDIDVGLYDDGRI